MRFRKKFYSFTDLFVRGWVVCGTILGAAYALGLYGFFYLVREGFHLTMFELRAWRAPFVFLEIDSLYRILSLYG